MNDVTILEPKVYCGKFDESLVNMKELTIIINEAELNKIKAPNSKIKVETTE